MCPFGGLDQFPSVEALVKNGKDRTLQAIELESGIGHQWRLWRWASYCASEVESKESCQTNLFSSRRSSCTFSSEIYCLLTFGKLDMHFAAKAIPNYIFYLCAGCKYDMRPYADFLVFRFAYMQFSFI